MPRLSDWERSVTEPEMVRLTILAMINGESGFAAGLARDMDINVKSTANGDIWVEHKDYLGAFCYLQGWMARARTNG